MASGLLGRTNREFPSIWLSLSLPLSADGIDELVQAVAESGVPIDITSQPALWGGKLRKRMATLMAFEGSGFQRATDESHACRLVQANLIEILSAIGREYIDFYFLRIRNWASEFQICGALRALEIARQEEHIKYIGIACDGDPMTTLGVWQFHDAFDVLLVPRNHYASESYSTLAPLASQRRVGVVTSRPLNWGHGLPFFALPNLWRLGNLTKSFYGLTLAQAVIGDLAQDHPVLVGVRTSEEVRQALEVPSLKLPTGLASMLEPYALAFSQPDEWRELLSSPNPVYADAATRRLG